MSRAAEGRLSRAALDRYPIGRGETRAVGHHWLATYDLAAGPEALLAALPARPDLVYVDPPWGAALATGFRTKAGAGGKADFPALMASLGRLIAALGCPAVVEMGDRWVETARAQLTAGGVAGPIRAVPGTYYRKQAMTYLIADAADADRLAAALRGRDDADAPGLALDLLRPATVLDPMCGRGLTAQHAARRGVRFLGNELAPYRAAATIALLQGAAA